MDKVVEGSQVLRNKVDTPETICNMLAQYRCPFERDDAYPVSL